MVSRTKEPVWVYVFVSIITSPIVTFFVLMFAPNVNATAWIENWLTSAIIVLTLVIFSSIFSVSDEFRD